MVSSKSVELDWKDRTLWFVHISFQQAVAIVLFNILWPVYKFLPADSLHTWHVILCTISYGFIMVESVALFASNTVLMIGINRATKGLIHGIFMGISTLTLTIGISLKIYQKDGHHFESTHAILGLTSMIITYITVFSGVVVRMPKVFAQYVRPIYTKIVHNFLGIATYVLGMVSLGYGVEYIKRRMAYDSADFTYILMGLIVAYSLIGASVQIYKNIKTIATN